MWAMFALLSAVFAGVNGILSKLSLRHADAEEVTTLRTLVVLAVAAGAVTVEGGWERVAAVSKTDLALLLASGAATAFAWICYFRGLEMGGVIRIAAADKLSVVLTLLGGWIFLGERLGWTAVAAILLITAGVALIGYNKSNAIDKQHSKARGRSWMVWAGLSVVSVTASTLLAKPAMASTRSAEALTIRTTAVIAVSGLAVWIKRRAKGRKNGTSADFAGLGRDGSLKWILLSGAATGLGWLCYFRALAGGEAGAVHAVDKLSVFITTVLAMIFLKERVTSRTGTGIALLTAGILVMYFR